MEGDMRRKERELGTIYGKEGEGGGMEGGRREGDRKKENRRVGEYGKE